MDEKTFRVLLILIYVQFGLILCEMLSVDYVGDKIFSYYCFYFK